MTNNLAIAGRDKQYRYFHLESKASVLEFIFNCKLIRSADMTTELLLFALLWTVTMVEVSGTSCWKLTQRKVVL